MRRKVVMCTHVCGICMYGICVRLCIWDIKRKRTRLCVYMNVYVCVRQKLAENTVVRWVGRRTCYGRVSSAAGEGGAYNTQTNIRALSFRCLSMGWSRLSPTHL